MRLRPMLIACDFDGTLSPLVADPWGALMLPAARRALRRLAAIPGVHVFIISARTVRDLAPRARVGGITYLGDHGAEHARAARGFRVSSLRVSHEPAPAAEAHLARELAREVPRRIREAWLVVEHKASSVAFHFRSAPNIPAAAARVHSAVDDLDPSARLVRHPGPRSLELRPRGTSSKASTFRRLLDDIQPGTAFMLGDDRHDADAFQVLREARSRGRLAGLAVAVAGHPDVTREVAPQADLLLSSPVDVARFLGGLADLP
ncbi:hypothetical protein BH23CHL8_BH23CHL8_22330 [soil metagenome]